MSLLDMLLERVPERARWWIAEVLDRRDDTCWTELVCWALDPYGNPLGNDNGLLGGVRRGMFCGDSPLAREEITRCGSCYCGKVLADGTIVRKWGAA